MPFEPDADTVIRWAWITVALSAIVFIVSAMGELLGWWNLVGEVGMSVSATVGILVTIALAFFGAGRDQVASVQEDVRSVDETVRAVHVAVLDNGRTLTSVDGKLDKLDELDQIQWALDEQTGVLTEIRDRL